MALVVDSGVLYAMLDAGDGGHERCASLLEEAREPRVVPAPVLSEVDWLCGRLHRDVFRRVLGQIDAGALVVEDLFPEDYRRAGTLLSTYADLRVGFVDAAVLAVVERLREPKLATLDHRHFSVMRPRHVESLELLPA
ncbi:MAG TPA: PIN domain-containing protein [Solirubrobacteraceae bacterium]|nr:PIN domain-containing protein [Solirubrobacteraceae bacterium]